MDMISNTTNTLKILLTLFIFFYSISVFAKTVIHAGQLIDGAGVSPLLNMTIIIEGNKIESVEKGFLEPGVEDQYIDLGSYFLLPGLMDMHVHLASEYSKNSYLERVTLNPADYAIRATANAKKTLMAGFTTVRNVGDGDRVTISLRDAINEGIVEGPRIFSSGRTIATTGGHGDSTNSLRDSLSSDQGPREGVVNGQKDAAKAVRYRYKEGADLIKITATGGVLSNAKNSQNPQFTDQELKIIVSTAKDYGFKVAAHAHGAEGIKRAVKAGVDSIEHGTLMDTEGMKLMREKGTYYVPTIIAGLWVAEKAKEPGFFPELVRPKALEIGPKIKTTFTKAYQSGVKIAFGTDTGVSEHGKNADEFIHMVDAGMPAMEAIQSATLEASKLLGLENTLGQVKSGYLADLVAVSEDPLINISILKEIDFVMKDGVVYKQP